MLLPLDFEMLRPLLFFLERKKMFVRVEMPEVILHAFQAWDQKPQDGQIKNKQKLKQKMSSRILNRPSCSLTIPSGINSFLANYSGLSLILSWYMLLLTTLVT